MLMNIIYYFYKYLEEKSTIKSLSPLFESMDGYAPISDEPQINGKESGMVVGIL